MLARIRLVGAKFHWSPSHPPTARKYARVDYFRVARNTGAIRTEHMYNAATIRQLGRRERVSGEQSSHVSARHPTGLSPSNVILPEMWKTPIGMPAARQAAPDRAYPRSA